MCLGSHGFDVRPYPAAILPLRVIGRSFDGFLRFHVQQEGRAVENGLNFARIENVKQNQLVTAVTKRLDCFDDRFRVFVEIRDDYGKTALTQHSLQLEKRPREIGSLPKRRAVEAMKQPDELTLSR